FYAWGEMGYVLLMLASVVANWLFGLLMEREQGQGKSGKVVLVAGIFVNLLPLLFFKYGNFLIDNLNHILPVLGMHPVQRDPLHLPIGISFYTFQAISYLVDLYRREVEVQRNPINLSLYIALFPQLIAGPIVRYHDIARQIVIRRTSLEDFISGMLRFTAGLGKKVLIANSVGAVADHIFSLPPSVLPAYLAWLGILSYTLQIYFDFSGYSDMAIGLGRMFGFHFQENFLYPYSSRSIQEFWRRWHISLSTWFRDYLYIPLGGSRKGTVRTYGNLLIVFFLCGLWHGAGWGFVIWGLYHGVFLVLERLAAVTTARRFPRIIQHIYTLLVVMVGWIFFRAETLDSALGYLAALVNFSALPYLDAKLFLAVNSQFLIAFVVGVLFSTPIVPWLRTKLSTQRILSRTWQPDQLAFLFTPILLVWMIVIFLFSSAELISGTHNPFLYFRF
ncbi:MAG: MBOAT family protein, partial [Candidatus Electrothrix sp. ATG1]|nr:MBOAT family protein [Candidatus Electrothrix sp. ATG1]